MLTKLFGILQKHLTPQRPEFTAHLRALAIGTASEYMAWCRREGFAPSAQKAPAQRETELLHARFERQLDGLDPRARRGARLVLDAVRGKANPQIPILGSLADRLRPYPRDVAWMTVGAIASRTDFFARLYEATDAEVKAIVRIAAAYGDHLRPIDEFTKPNGAVRDQIRKLIRHLFVQHDIPAFFDDVWFAADQADDIDRFQQRTWYLEVGRGRSIRDCNLPAALTARQAHLLMTNTRPMSIVHAIRWAQLMSFGVAPATAEAVVNSRLGRCFDFDTDENRPFFEGLFRWLAEYRLFPVGRVPALIDWALTERFHTLSGYNEEGKEVKYGPRQPRLVMRGRTMASVLQSIAVDPARSARWFNSRPICRDAYKVNKQHQTVSIGSLGAQASGDWVFHPLMTPDALVDEGDEMHHCVGDMVEELECGCEFWSVRRGDDSREHRFTVCLDSESLSLREANGFDDRDLQVHEYDVVTRWIEIREESVANRSSTSARSRSVSASN